MPNPIQFLTRSLRSRELGSPENGAALAEWGLLVVLIAIVAILAVTLTGQEVSGQYSSIASAVSQ